MPRPDPFGKIVLILALTTSSCVVSFSGYELAERDASAGGTGGTATGGSAGSVGGTGNSGGTNPNGGASGMGGATGGVGATGASGGSGGSGASGASGGTAGTDGGIGGTGGTFVCPSTPAITEMVAVPRLDGSHYCIDATEVTQKQYSDFIFADPNKSTHPACSGNTSIVPPCAEYNASAYPDKPVFCVDWCDAHAYCTWVKKHLCGSLDANPITPGDAANASKSEWYRACSEAGQRLYPYGPAYSMTACNGVQSSNLLTTDVGSLAKCVGGYPGIFDMSGNVEEWENACASDTSASTTCTVRGGNYSGADVDLTCKAAPTAPRMENTSLKRGFRCCAG